MFKELIPLCLLVAIVIAEIDVTAYKPQCKTLGAYARIKYNENCQKYVECISDTDAKPQDCPLGLAYDEDTESCIWKSDVDSCDQGTSGDVCVDPQGGPTCIPDDESYDIMRGNCAPKGSVVCKEDEVIPQCSKQTEYKQKFIADKEDCAGYYYCDENNKRYKGTCPTGYYFDPKNQMCSHKDSEDVKNCKAVKKSSSSASTTDSVDWDTVCSGKKSTFIPDPRLCIAYIYCNENGHPRQDFCPTGTYFNNGSCTKTKPSSCTCESFLKKDNEEADAYEKEVPHTDSKKYYVCTNGDRKLEECGGNSVFDKVSQSCKM